MSSTVRFFQPVRTLIRGLFIVMALSTAALALDPPTEISYSQTTIVFGKNNPISALTPTVSGSAEGLTFSVAAGTLPPGLSLNTTTGVITGMPTTTGSYIPLIEVANGAGSVSQSLLLVVTGFTYSSPVFTLGRNVAMTLRQPSGIVGGGGGAYSVTPSLPAGITFNTTNGAISGTPSVSATTGKYVVSRTFSGVAAYDTLTITVNGFSYLTNRVTLGENQLAFAPHTTVSSSGLVGSGGTYSVTPALPAGLSLDPATGEISGSPTVQAAGTKYAISRTFTSGTARDTVTLIVNGFTYEANVVSYPVGVPIAPNTPTNIVGTGGRYALLVGLPIGLALDTSTGAISGTPTGVTSSMKVAIYRNFSGAGAFDTVTITITDEPPTSLAYSVNPARYTQGQPITMNRLSVKGGLMNLTYSIIAGTLPTGMGFGPTGNIYSNEGPTQTGTFPITVRAANSGGSVTTDLTIVISAPKPEFSYASDSVTVAMGTSMTTIAPLHTGGTVLSWAVSPRLPDGLVLNGLSGRISGTPVTASPATRYTVIGTGHQGAADTAFVVITTTPIAPTVSYSDVPSLLTLGQPITEIARTGSSGIITSYAISPALPSGLRFNTTSGRIDGTPTVVSAATNYVITATGPGGTGRDTINLSVVAVAPTINYTKSILSYPVGAAIEPIARTSSSGLISSYSITPALPSGLLFNTTTGRLDGTPIATSATRWYVITANGPGGAGKDSIRLTTVANPPFISFEESEVAFVTGTAISRFRAVNSGGPITRWQISNAANGKSLTANTGLFFNTTTGYIDGTPRFVTAPTGYTILAFGFSGSLSASLVTIETHAPGAGAKTAVQIPVTGEAGVAYRVPVPATEGNMAVARLVVTDLTGRTVWSRTVTAADAAAGVLWDGREASGRLVPAGVYFAAWRLNDGGTRSRSGTFRTIR